MTNCKGLPWWAQQPWQKVGLKGWGKWGLQRKNEEVNLSLLPKFPSSKAQLLVAALPSTLSQAVKLHPDITIAAPKILFSQKYFKLWEIILCPLGLRWLFNRWKLRHTQIIQKKPNSTEEKCGIIQKLQAPGGKGKIFPFSQKNRSFLT